MTIPQIIRIAKAAINVEKAEKKQAELDKLQAIELNYGIIRDLINSASHGVKIEVIMKDGNRFIIERDDPLTKLSQTNYTEAF